MFDSGWEVRVLFSAGTKIVLFATTPTPTLESTHSCSLGIGASFAGVKVGRIRFHATVLRHGLRFI